jgi:hypothetical protein
MQVGGSMMRLPMFTCKFRCRTNSDLRRPPADWEVLVEKKRKSAAPAILAKESVNKLLQTGLRVLYRSFHLMRVITYTHQLTLHVFLSNYSAYSL